MTQDLPHFKYHPDPVATGAVAPSDVICGCCGLARGAIYTGVPYVDRADDDDIVFCPWCIADGSAAARFGASFVSHCEGELEEPAQTELFERTPGYESWQGETWLCHCGDACAFLGEMTGERFAALPDAVFEREAAAQPCVEGWRDNRAGYQRGTDMSVYEFRCRHCGEILLHSDAS